MTDLKDIAKQLKQATDATERPNRFIGATGCREEIEVWKVKNLKDHEITLSTYNRTVNFQPQAEIKVDVYGEMKQLIMKQTDEGHMAYKKIDFDNDIGW